VSGGGGAGVCTIALLHIEPLGSEFGGGNTWRSRRNLGYFPYK
jgi:hypothetical protein